MNIMQTVAPERALPKFFHGANCKKDIRDLLENSESILGKEGVLDQLIQLEDWLEATNRNAPSTRRVMHDGLSCLHEMRERLNRKADDLIRLEGEGGLPATPAQEQEIAELTRAIKRIDHMICLIDGTRPS